MESRPISRAFGFLMLMIATCVLGIGGELEAASICFVGGLIFDAIKSK